MGNTKILIFMGGFFPGKKFGGPPVSVDNFCTAFPDYSCFIVTHDTDKDENERYKNITDGWNNRGNCQVKYLPDSEYNMKTFNTIVEEIQPDLVYLQGVFQYCIIPVLRICKQKKIPVLLAPRGELCHGAFKKSIKKYHIFM